MEAQGVLILSAGIGEGHDLPARWLAAGLAEEAPGLPVEIVDSVAAMGPLVERVVASGSSFDTRLGNLMFDLEHRLITRVRAPARVHGLGQRGAGRARARCA